MSGALALRPGARIAVIGGGPSGSFFAHFAAKWASRLGIDVSLTIFDGKDFLQRGPRGCNLCAGVIARSLYEKLKEEDILLPEGRIINKVDGYSLHVRGESLLLSCVEMGKDPVPTVFRGNGPRYATFPETVSFDDFLLTWVQDRGAEVVPHPVWDIRLPGNDARRVRIIHGPKEAPLFFEADLVVGAFGLNAVLMKKASSLGFGYKAPSTIVTYQAEFKLGRREVEKRFGNSIHVHMPPSRLIRYVTITPKADYITVTLIGKGNVTAGTLDEFFNLECIRDKIPRQAPQCFCFPRIAVSPARTPYADRLVIIGDAGFSRHYKNGLESAFDTAELAAGAVFQGGVDAASFREHYFRPSRMRIIRDNAYGRILFRANDLISSIPLLSRAHLDLAGMRPATGASKKARSILWNMFTGDLSYRRIFLAAADIGFQLALLKRLSSLLFLRAKKILRSSGKDISHAK